MTFVPLAGVQVGPEYLQVMTSKEQVRSAPDIELRGEELTQADESRTTQCTSSPTWPRCASWPASPPTYLEAKSQVDRWYDGYRIVVSEVTATYDNDKLPV